MKTNPTQKKFKKKEPDNPPFSGRMCRIYFGSPMSKPIIWVGLSANVIILAPHHIQREGITNLYEKSVYFYLKFFLV